MTCVQMFVIVCLFLVASVFCQNTCPNTGLPPLTPPFDFQLCLQYQDNSCCRLASEVDIQSAWSNAVQDEGNCNYGLQVVRPRLIDYYCFACDPYLSYYLGSWPDFRNSTGTNQFFFGDPGPAYVQGCTNVTQNCSLSSLPAKTNNTCTNISTTCTSLSNCNDVGCSIKTCTNITLTNITCISNVSGSFCDHLAPNVQTSCSFSGATVPPFVVVSVVPTYFMCDEFVQSVFNIQLNGSGSATSDFDVCGIRSPGVGIVYPSTYLQNGAIDYTQIVTDFPPDYLILADTESSLLNSMSQQIINSFSNMQNFTINSNWANWTTWQSQYNFINTEFQVDFPQRCFYPAGSSAYTIQISLAMLIFSVILVVLF